MNRTFQGANEHHTYWPGEKEMRKRSSVEGIIWLLAIAMLIGMVGCGLARRRAARAPVLPEEYVLKGKVIQRLKAFDNPESAAFSADGKFVFVSNAGELGLKREGLFWVEHGGFISKLAVQPDGTLKMVDPKLIDGLTGPLGLAVSTKATRTFPAGTIFVSTGNLPMAESSGERVINRARVRGEIIGVSPNGEPLGAISWGVHSELAAISGAPATHLNGMAFDKAGDLYVAETGMGGETVSPAIVTRPGVMMIPHGALDDLAAQQTPREMPLFVPIPGGPDGVSICPVDQSLHVNTVGMAAGMPDPDRGGMFRLQRGDLASGVCPPPFASGFGALDGLAFLPDGARLDTQIL
ncbi:MAG: hypothetical protein ACXADY_27370, partial [Candidatus Hodarchaeales archaeon]